MTISEIKKELKYELEKTEATVLFLQQHNFLIEKMVEQKKLEILKTVHHWIKDLEEDE